VLEKFVQKFYGLGTGSGPSQFEKSDPDPDKNRPDPQHCSEQSFFYIAILIGRKEKKTGTKIVPNAKYAADKICDKQTPL
jgi:hypothetical protein